MPDLRQDLQALIGPEEEWPDEVKRYVEKTADEHCADWRNYPLKPTADAALLAVARMVKGGTCLGCRHFHPEDENEWEFCRMDIEPPGFAMGRSGAFDDFGCTLFSPTEEPK